MSRTLNIAVIAGDGIGPEVTAVALEAADLAASRNGFALKLTQFPHSGAHYLKTGEVLSDETVDELRKHQAILLGAVGTPAVKPGIIEKGLLLKLRFDLDLYINLRPVKLYPNVACPLSGKGPADIDYIVVRENSGDLYTGIGGVMMKGSPHEVAEATMVYTRHQVERCLRYAFQTAMARPRKKLTLVGKSNVVTHVYDLWLRVMKELQEKEFPQVQTDYIHVDACVMFMIKTPERFDVIVTTNMFGDIITDLGAETQGGMGMAASGNLNPDRTAPSMFEPIHGSAPDIAGQDKANPIAAIMSARMLLEFLGENTAAAGIDRAISTYCARHPLTLPTSQAAKNFMAILKDSL